MSEIMLTGNWVDEKSRLLLERLRQSNVQSMCWEIEPNICAICGREIPCEHVWRVDASKTPLQ